MYALRERRVHVTQEDFEMAVAKVQCAVTVLGGLVVISLPSCSSLLTILLLCLLLPLLSPAPLCPSSPVVVTADHAEGCRQEHVGKETVEVTALTMTVMYSQSLCDMWCMLLACAP